REIQKLISKPPTQTPRYRLVYSCITNSLNASQSAPPIPNFDVLPTDNLKHFPTYSSAAPQQLNAPALKLSSGAEHESYADPGIYDQSHSGHDGTGTFHRQNEPQVPEGEVSRA